MKTGHIFLLIVSFQICSITNATEDVITPQYSETVYYVNGSCGNDSWSGISPSCSAPNGPKRTIQAAINAAAQEDLIVIYPGTYYENLLINSKNLALISTDPYDSNIVETTIIDGNNFGSVINTINSDCLFKGLSIKNGRGLKGGGIYSQGGNLKVKKCIITNNKTLSGFESISDYPPPQEIEVQNLTYATITSEDPNGGDGGGIYCDNALIEDCNISNNTTGKGFADDDSHIYGKGGNGAGIYCNGQLNINNCIMANNTAGNGGYDYHRCFTKGGDGGAVYISLSSSAVIKNSIIKNNKSGNGGIFIYPREISLSYLTATTYGSGVGGDGGGIFCMGNAQVDNTIISSNTSGQGLCPGFGGGAFFTSSSNLTMTDCLISQNKTADGGWYGGDGGQSGGSGGGIWCASQTANFENCNFINNICGDGHWGDYGESVGTGGSGGGICLVLNLQITMNRCIFTGNKTGNGGGGYMAYGKSGGYGGGVHCWADSANFLNCIITGNSTGNGGDISDNSYSRGGNGGGGAGICCKTGLIANCLIANNITGNGGGAEGQMTFAGNGGNGGGVYCTSSFIINSTIASNLTGEKGVGTGGGADGIDGRGSIYCDANTIIANSILWNEGVEQFAGQDSNNIKYCDIIDSNYAGVNGNICTDPLFVNADANNFHLAINSLCIDAGDNSSVPVEITADLDGNLRFFDIPYATNSGNGTPPIVDIGPYEYVLTIFNETQESFHATIQDAVDCADEGDRIFVGEGIYTGNGNRDIDFGGKDLILYGTGNHTIIDCIGTKNEPHRAFKFVSGETYNSVIDGFTIINGFAPNEIWNGNSHSAGGAIYCNDANPTIRNCKFINNDSNDRGGAICCYDSTSNILNCIFEDNNSVNGGAIYNHISEIDVSTIIVKNCLFNQNIAAKLGGAIFNSCGNPKIINCTLYDNQALVSGGAIKNDNSNSLITNSIIWNNFAPTEAQISNDSSNPVVQYCDISGGYIGTGNFEANPHFTDAENGDFHLKSQFGRWDENLEQWVYDNITSPCIDAGVYGGEYGNWTEELWPHGRRINIGFYGGTSQASMSGSLDGNIADLNNSEYINYYDLMQFAESWLIEENLLKEDLNRDGSVDFSDYVIFADNWRWHGIPQE